MSNHMVQAYALIIMRKDNQILLLKRADTAKFAPGHYSLIGGAVEKDETFRQTVVREAHEEVGVTIDPDDLHFVHTFYRKGAEHELVACVFECNKWQGEPFNKEPEKHPLLEWIDADKLPEKMIPAHGGALALIAQGCMYSEQKPGKVE